MPILYRIYELLLKQYGPQNWWPGESFDEVIIGAVLTQNTNWQNVVRAIENLKAENLCSLAALKRADKDYLALLIRPSGYYNVKSERLIDIAGLLDGKDIAAMDDVAAVREFLLSIKGIGEETADSIMLYAYGLPAFVIDAYTRRFIDRLRPDNNLQSYKDYQDYFTGQLPRQTYLYNEYHALIVRHCKLFCRKQPQCSKCFIHSRFCHFKP